MFLKSLHVENFRGIKHATLTMEGSTVFIGENDCGKSSLLEAIAIALGVGADGSSFAFQAIHAHRLEDAETPPRILIQLFFEERHIGQWNPILPEKFRLWPRKMGALKRLMFEVRAEFGADPSKPVIGWGARTAEDGPLVHENDNELLIWIRQKCPVLWLRGGIVSSSPAPEMTIEGGRADLATSKLIEQVEQHYRAIADETSSDFALELERGFDAAKSLLLQTSQYFDPTIGGLGPALQEITGRTRARAQHAAGPPRLAGGAAHKIGLLLLVGAVFRNGRPGLTPGAEPIIIIEDPEAHLHPMTLASVWGILEQIRWQKIITTHSGTLLSAAPLCSIRRLSREQGVILEWSIPEGRLSKEELRRWGYHIRSRRASAIFARCWLFVEGETEFWILPELARILGYDLAAEGISCVEFAQSGLTALIKVARHLGIEWHLLADGDQAGEHYVHTAEPYMDEGELEDRITILGQRDIERCFWDYGFSHVYKKVAFPTAKALPKGSAESVIPQAINRSSKPFLALEVLESAASRGPESVPPPLRTAIETSVRLARQGKSLVGGAAMVRPDGHL